ncbi:TadE/TadG family type IV pilus assembly protein [Halomonas sp. B23F22_10]|uniref:TadE/TadG family type IV pilus assembly protein n=1 Tax=Halomonas sp. B23F22_10 TaxID=3459515 RepID=UPI00373E17AF
MSLARYRSRRRDKGSVAIEFAIIFPLFLLILYAIVSYAICFAVVFTLHGISSDAARAVLSIERTVLFSGDPNAVDQEIADVVNNSWLSSDLIRGCVDGNDKRYELIEDNDLLKVCLEVRLTDDGSEGDGGNVLSLPRLSLLGITVPHLEALESSSTIRL